MRYLANTRYDNCASERGAVFFYILLAVALFAALSYAVSRNNRGSVSILTDQQAKLAAQEIIEYGNNVAQAVQKLRLRGVADTEISFENDVYKELDGDLAQPASEFPNCTTNDCKVFNNYGGAILPSIISDIALADLSDQIGTSFLKPGYSYFISLKMEGVGSDDNDLVLRIPFLKTNTCLKINNSLGINNPGGNPPEDGVGGWTEYKNTYTGTGITGDEATNLVGKTSFCSRWPGGSLGDERENHFYQVLIAR